MNDALPKAAVFSGLPPAKSWTNTIYPLNRGDLEAEQERLNYNHHRIWLPLTGELAPPHVLDAVKKFQAPRIADVATGNGVWLKSMAEEMPPQAELYGFDLDTVKFPPVERRMPNMTFQQHDILNRFPQELHGTFDLVHVRLLIFALKSHEWSVTIQHIMELLKPGGWIVWEEVGQISMRSFPPSRAFDEWWRLHLIHLVNNGGNEWMPYRLVPSLRSAGLENCDHRIWSTWSSETVNQDDVPEVLIGLVKPTLTSVVESGGLEIVQTMEDVLLLESNIIMDIRNGMKLGFDWYRAWGMKP
ncbi:methyltransferase domain-containing protein [Stachybotrys elegans]|uniref:Methyltransferase domain-containing protein n=1 Tax=Stachybotrys elegans TaxID=80388 RepID=A0A8K0SY19_9HYPO|nr:methyltransferase domain-containing protein [Stachybotrys elegans]